jgi:hypothetical protein
VVVQAVINPEHLWLALLVVLVVVGQVAHPDKREAQGHQVKVLLVVRQTFHQALVVEAVVVGQLELPEIQQVAGMLGQDSFLV